MQWERKLDLRGPLEQAERCLGQWLKEEKRTLPAAERKRVAALMARYFYHEDEVTDQLMMSFLRHYSNGNALDMEDPTSVRMEIKSVLDQSRVRDTAPFVRKGMAVAAVIVLLAGMYGWTVTQRPITRAEQADLKKLVHEVVAHNAGATTDAVWNAVKKPLHIRRYQDMDQWQYWRSKSMLQKQLQKK